MRVRRTSRRAGQLDIVLVVILCLSVFLQMLGVPAPLLNAGESFDVCEASLSEGFALVMTSPQCVPSPTRELVRDRDSSLHVPVLAGSLFHPPVS